MSLYICKIQRHRICDLGNIKIDLFTNFNEKFVNKCYNKFCKRLLQNLKNGEINL